MSVAKRGEKWLVRWVDVDGVHRGRTFDRKADAQRFERQALEAKARGSAHDSSVTLGDYGRRWAARQTAHRSATVKSYAALLRDDSFVMQALGHRKLARIVRGDVEQLVADALAAGYAPSTVKLWTRQLATILTAAHRDRVVPDVATAGVRVPTPPRTPEGRLAALDDEQLVAVLEALPAHPWRDFARFILATGMRPAEAAGVTWSRISSDGVTVDRQLVVRELAPTKTASSSRLVPLPPALLAELEQRRGEPDDFVFVDDAGHALDEGRRRHAWHKATRSIPLPAKARGWHALRHTAASRWLDAGVSPALVARQLGHSDMTMLLTTYGHSTAAPTALPDVTSGLLATPRA